MIIFSFYYFTIKKAAFFGCFLYHFLSFLYSSFSFLPHIGQYFIGNFVSSMTISPLNTVTIISLNSVVISILKSFVSCCRTFCLDNAMPLHTGHTHFIFLVLGASFISLVSSSILLASMSSTISPPKHYNFYILYIKLVIIVYPYIIFISFQSMKVHHLNSFQLLYLNR